MAGDKDVLSYWPAAQRPLWTFYMTKCRGQWKGLSFTNNFKRFLKNCSRTSALQKKNPESAFDLSQLNKENLLWLKQTDKKKKTVQSYSWIVIGGHDKLSQLWARIRETPAGANACCACAYSITGPLACRGPDRLPGIIMSTSVLRQHTTRWCGAFCDSISIPRGY